MAERQGLEEDVANDGGLDGAGEHDPTGRISGHLVEQSVLAAPSDDVERVNATLGNPFHERQHFSIEQGEALEDAARNLGRRIGLPLLRRGSTAASLSSGCLTRR